MIFDLCAGTFEPGRYVHSIAFIGLASLVGFMVGLPFVIWRTFVVEERFGFNKMTPGFLLRISQRKACSRRSSAYRCLPRYCG
jgi:STE24 endopeptidase